MVPFLLMLVFAAAGGAQAQTDCASELCTLIAQGRLDDLRWEDFGPQQAKVRLFYSPQYAFAWSRDGMPTAEAAEIVRILHHADEKGLNPEDYDASRWEGRLGHLRDAGRQISKAEFARFDLALTVSILRYMADLHFGRTNPGLFHARKSSAKADYDPVAVLHELAKTTASEPIFSKLEPPYTGYRRTEEALKIYLELAANDKHRQLPLIRKAVKPGALYAGTAELANLLRKLGDLPQDAKIPEDGIYQGALVDAVKRFQERHGLEPDGQIGLATVAQLNTPLSARVHQLALTLERWRWAPHSFPRPPIVVNIPEFRLRGLNADYMSEIEMKVVAGGAYGHQTPVFSAQMDSVIFRPYWDVPLSIQRKELAPKIEKDPSYLASHDYEVVTRQGRVVTRGDVDAATLAELKAGGLAIRQRPGPNNSLGLVKFMLPNPYDVYLHATPAMELFSKSRRDFSHGCIRVEKPEELAAWVLRGLPGWTPDRIEAAMNGDKTFEVKLKTPIPVLVVYATAVALAGGEVHFFPDIYNEDAKLSRALAAERPYEPVKPIAKATSGGRGPRPHE